MRITHNELVDYSAQAIRGATKRWGSVGITTSSVAELEILGLGAVRQFCNLLLETASAHNADDTTHPIDTEIKNAIAESRNNKQATVVVDFQQSLDIYYYFILQNYILEAINPQSQLIIHNCAYPQLMAGALLTLQPADIDPSLSISIKLEDTQYNQILQLTYSAETSHGIKIYKPSTTAETSSLTLTAGRQSSQQSKNFQEATLQRQLSYSDIENARVQAWKYGIDIDPELWDIIKRYAKLQLVPDDAESHSRAGE